MSAGSLDGIKILLVDDEADLLAMTKARLEIDGASVEGAVNGKHAIECFQEKDFEIVVTDIRMPEMDGRELVQNIREEDQKTPIICMSGFSDYTDEEIFAWGANENFRKPLPINQLIEKILELTGKNSE